MPDPVKPDDRGALENTDPIVDDFDAAFETAADLGDRAELSPADDPKNVPEVPEPVIEDKTVPEPVAEVPVVSPPVPDPAIRLPGESDAKFEQRYLTLQGIHKHDKENWETEKAKLLSDLEEAKKPIIPPTPEKKPETAIPLDLEDSLSEEDKAALKEYDEEFDVVAKMEGKKREVALRALKKEVSGFIQNLRDELKSEFATQLAPATTFVEKAEKLEEIRTQEAHFAAIRNSHPDFENYRDDGSILKWVESKPSYLRKGALETYTQGSAEEIVELLSDFKRENNLSTPQPPNNVVQINPVKEAKRQAMTAVTTRRGAVNASMTVANDFEGAFDEAMNKHGGK
jgi:hypothetical protein